MEKAPLDLHRSVDLAVVLGCTSSGFCDVIAGRWFGPPGLGSYFTAGNDNESAAGLMFACPGCGELTSIAFRDFDGKPKWTWNGDRQKPTAQPSIFSDPAKGGCGWHGFLTAGRFTSC